MSKVRSLWAIAAMSALVVAGLPSAASAKDHGRTESAIGGLIVGGAVVSALSPRKKVVETVYVPATIAAPPPSVQDSFTPTSGIICYTSQRSCYTMGGGYNPNWTWKIFAR